jgi:hypothetical protein
MKTEIIMTKSKAVRLILGLALAYIGFPTNRNIVSMICSGYPMQTIGEVTQTAYTPTESVLSACLIVNVLFLLAGIFLIISALKECAKNNI